MFFSRTFVITLVFLSSQAITALAAPATGPAGENSAGKFSEYFQNAVDNPCDSSSYMVGFLTSPYMTPDCRLFPSSFRAWLLTGNTSSPTDFIGTINNEALRIRTNNTEKMIVSTGGDVGIGTSTPLAKLQVVGDTFIQGTIINSDAIEVGQNRTGNRFSYIDFHGDDTYADYGLRVLRGNTGPDAISLIEHLGSGEFTIRTAQSAPLVFETNSTDRMTILGNGNVGIGTTSPGEKLQVTGNTLTNNILTQMGNGNGLCFWSDCTNYKIAMGNPADYQYGPVTDYSIKSIIDGGAGRGFTWGRAGVVPVASINATTGNMQIDGTFNAGGTITAPTFVGNLTGNASTASSVPWSGVTGKPTTISGITGADSIGVNPNTRLSSGFYEQSNAQIANGWPENAGTWWHLISSTHSNTTNYYAMQFAASFFSNKLYYRSTNGTGSTAWGRIPLADGGTYAMNISGNSNYATSAGSFSGFNNPTTAATANTIVYRDSGGHTYANYSFANYFNAASGNSENPAIGQIWTQNTTDNYLRKSTPAHFKSQLGLVDTTTYGQDISTVKHFLSNKGAGAYVGANNDWSLQAYSTDGGAAGMSFHRAGLGAVNFGLDPDNIIRFGGWSAPANIWALDLAGNNTILGNMTASSVYTNNWFRSTGASGWYSETYGGGWHMLDTTWIRGYNGKSLWMGSGLIGGDGGLTVGYGGAGPNTTGGAIIAGNVGIGTTTPAAKLDVAGDIRTTSNNYLNNSGPVTFYQDTDNRSAMIHVNSNQFYILRGDGNNSTSWATFNGYWPLQIDLETNNALFGGNISALAGNLTVANASAIAGTTYGFDAIEQGAGRTGNRYSYIDFHGDDTYTDFGLRILRGNGGPDSWSDIAHRGAGNFNIITEDAAPMVFKTSGAERMRINQNGKVIIGSDPLYEAGIKFQIQETRTETTPTSTAEFPYFGAFTSWIRQTVNPSGNSTTGNIGAYTEVQTQVGNNYNFSGIGNHYGSYTTFSHRGGGAITNNATFGVEGGVTNWNGGSIGNTVAVQGSAYNFGAGYMTNAAGIRGAIQNSGAGYITNARAVDAEIIRGAGTITNGYGVYIRAIQATNPWSIYSTDASATMYHAGRVSIGSNNIYPDIKVLINHEDTNPNISGTNWESVKAAQFTTFRSNPSADTSFWTASTASHMEVPATNTRNNTAGIVGAGAYAWHRGSGLMGIPAGGLNGGLVGVFADAKIRGAGSAVNVQGVRAVAALDTSSTAATATNAIGVFGEVNNVGAGGNITNAYGLMSEFYIPNGRRPVNGYGLYLGSLPADNPWSIYSTDASATMYHAGKVSIGSTNIYPDIKVYIEHEDASPTVGTPNIYGVKANQMNVFYSNPSTDMSIWQGGTISIMEVKEGNTRNNTLGQTAITGFSNHKGSGRIGQVIGINSQSTLMGPGNAFRLTGLEARAWVDTTSPSARADEAMAVLATIDNLGAGGGNITNAYGLYTQITASNGRPATNGYGLYMGQINATNRRFSIYATDGNATSFFQAGIGINMENTPWSGYGLMINGNGYALGSFYDASDRNLKKNIVPVKNPLEKILSLTGYTFDWRKDGTHSMGVIAQEVQEVFPDIVTSATNSGVTSLGVNYSALTAPLIESIKILANEDKKSDTLDIVQDENIALLKRQNEVLKAQNEKLSQDIEQIKKLLKDNY